VAREQRLVFGEDAALYDRARPSYPETLIHDLVELVGTGAWVADVGCGTGKATVLLAAAGLRGVGVEAHPAMGAIAADHLRSNPDWRVDIAPFETWTPNPEDLPLDLMTSAQAWHWIDPAVRFHKAHALLRPGGWLALFWNRPWLEDSPLRADMDAAYNTHAPGMIRRGMGINGRPIFETNDAPTVEAVKAMFAEPILRSYDWTATYTSQEWIDVVTTQSDHRLLEPASRDALLAALRDIIDAHGGTYVHPYTCWLWTAQKPATAS
jgi:SAM-dependent methyltransferase